MKATVIQDAEILIPNSEHKSFSGSNKYIKKGTEIEGMPSVVEGFRRGSIFNYRLFKTDKNQYIFLNKINPVNMATTEVTLSAEGQTPTTVIDVESSKLFGKSSMIGAALGAGAGFIFATKYKKYNCSTDCKKILPLVIGGAILGYFSGKFVYPKVISITKKTK